MAKVSKSRIGKGYVREWISLSNLLSGLALLVAIVSAAASIRSCDVAKDAYALASAEHQSQRKLVLVATLDVKGEELQFKASDPAIVVQDVRLTFPASISSSPFRAYPPRYNISMRTISARLSEVLAEKFPVKIGHVGYSPLNDLPVVIETDYVAKGQRYRDVALYSLRFDFTVADRLHVPPSVSFKSIAFADRFDSWGGAEKALAEAWLATQAIAR